MPNLPILRPAAMTLFTAGVAGLVAGCGTPPAPPPPALLLAVDYEQPSAGAPGPTNVGPPARLAVTVHANGGLAGTPLDAFVETITADRGPPFRAGSALLRGLRLAEAGAVVAGEPAAAADAVVGDDFTTRIRVTGSGLPELLAVRTATGLRLALRSSDEEGTEVVRLQPFELAGPRREVTLLQRDPDGDREVVIVLRPGDDAAAAAVESVRRQLAGAAAEPELAPVSTEPTVIARQAIGGEPRRRALLAVAAKYELPRCLDLLLCLGEAELVAIGNAVPAEVESAWQVERAFYDALLPALQRGELPPEVVFCLRRHVGALALDPTAFEFAIAASPTAAEFEAALVADNLRALTDRRTRHRMTAADWLAARELAVEGYDALAPRAERMAALAAHGRRRR